MGMIRTVLALAVVFTHSPWLKGYVFVGGRYAVQLFYIISGFLICHVLHRNPAYRDPLRFYASRALRLYPVYYVVLALSLVAVLGANRKFFDLYEKIPPSAAALLAVTNVTLLGQDWVLFSGVSEGKLVFEPEPFKGSGILLLNGLLVPQAWTLGVELSFYLVAPFLLRNRRLMLGILLLSLLLRVVLVVDGLGRKDPWTYRFFPLELALFLVGAFSQQLLLPFWTRRASQNPWLCAAGTAFLLVFILNYFLIPVRDAYKAAALFSTFALLLPLAFLYQNGSARDRKIGELSYPIYIGHMLVISTISVLARKLGWSDPFAITMANIAGATAFAALLNWLVAERVEAFRTRLKAARAATA